MVIAIVSVALLGIVLFLCLAIVVGISDERAKGLSSQIVGLKEENIKLSDGLTNYMDMTRAEALNSYRKGLQDGIAMSQAKPIAFVEPKPIKTMEEHSTEIAESKEQSEASKAYNEGLSAILNYTGDVPPKEE